MFSYSRETITGPKRGILAHRLKLYIKNKLPTNKKIKQLIINFYDKKRNQS